MAHLAHSYGWSEDCMMEMSLQRLMLYYTASLNLPYIIEVEAPQADSRQKTKADNNATEIKQGNKTIRREKQGALGNRNYYGK
ncbi:hypothetical protein OFQ51_01435 [Brachyspira hyodysenteriae]|uniref:hypothetical protein n=1 Tax=Brachyspira hyodysenteriae TaxID=159 RepID=UPI0022CD50C4|nr:hypothetical protein [Brachyspira hyodysenteriae]MCZ9949308.1 hypothetical protein [Brachyspira hyodysenteriae]